MRSTRPDAKITLKSIELTWEIFGFLLLISYWVFVIKIYPSLPEIIPSHINIKGEIDDYASKSSVWSLLNVPSSLYVLLTIVSFFPKYFNYMVEITVDNAEKEYRKAVGIIRFLKIIILILSFSITLFIIGLGSLDAMINDRSNRNWLLTLILATIFIPIAYYQSAKNKSIN